LKADEHRSGCLTPDSGRCGDVPFRGTTTSVIELVPPYVQTYLMGEHQANDPRATPLETFVTEVMDILTTQPDIAEVVVKRCEPLRFAAENGLAKMFQTVNS
jgi:uncharacterized oxidoreductase